jgi:hypothetical protein
MQANGAITAQLAAEDWGAVVAHYNATASPTFTVWKSSVPLSQIGVSFVASELAGLSQVNLTRLQTIATYQAIGTNPSIASNRAFYDDVFSGAGGVNTRAALLALWKRLANRVERVFATGTGSDASPGILVVEGTLTQQNASDVMGGL